MLVFFVGHIAGRINVDTVIELVARRRARRLRRLARPDPGPPAAAARGSGAMPTVVRDARRGYLQHLDEAGLADWAAEQGTAVRLLVRPGDYVFPGAPIAWLTRPAEGAEAAIHCATALGPQRTSADDLEFAVRQLVEVAVRALSPGINDPHTAMSVLDRLGTALCELAPLHLSTGVLLREERPALVVPPFDYDGLVDAMFHLIRQSAAGNAAVLIRLLEVLAAVLGVEADPSAAGARSAAMPVWCCSDAEREIANLSDLADVRRRFAATRPAAVSPQGSRALDAARGSAQPAAPGRRPDDAVCPLQRGRARPALPGPMRPGRRPRLCRAGGGALHPGRRGAAPAARRPPRRGPARRGGCRHGHLPACTGC